jgi:hypothetical protein
LHFTSLSERRFLGEDGANINFLKKFENLNSLDRSHAPE